MIVRYSSLERLEKPKMTLCNPGSVYNDGVLTNVVGILCDHEAEEGVYNFNATSELNFRMNRVVRDDAEEAAYTDMLFRSLQNRRLIFLEDVGYFMITNVVDSYDGKARYKDVKAESIDVEIQQKMVPYIADGTYRFATSGDDKGLLETVVESLPLWTIGHVDTAVASKWRTFEDVDTSENCLAFLQGEVQDAYECIVLFDIVNRTINVYDQNNYVRRTDVHITKDDVINSLNITEDASDVYTAIAARSDDEAVTIGAVNPTGSNVIYNFNYYLGWMPDALSAKVSAWQNAISAAEGNYYIKSLTYYQKLQQKSDIEAEIGRLGIQGTMYQRCRDNIVAEGGTSLVESYNDVIEENGGTSITIQPQIEQTLAQIDTLLGEVADDTSAAQTQLSAIESQLAAIKAELDQTRDTLAIEKYFTQAEMDTLGNYIYEGEYNDEYVTTTDIMTYEEKFGQMKILYDRAKEQLVKVSQPTQEFTVDVENFLFAKEFEAWSEQLEMGCLINVELEQDDVAALFLSNMTVNYDDRKMTMTFGNRFNKFDPKSLFDDVLGSVNRTANTLGYIKDVLYPIKNGELNSMAQALQSSRNLTMGNALASTDEEVVIDGSGYTGRKKLSNGEYDPHQIKITGKNIVFTDDAWESSKAAIGEITLGGNTYYGVNAEAIIGDIIVGNNLRIVDSNGDDMFTAIDGRITTSVEQVYADMDDMIGYRIEIISTSDVLSDAITSTTLTARVWHGSEDVTNQLPASRFQWKRKSADSTADGIWNGTHTGIKSITLTTRDILYSATYDCELIKEDT